MQPTLAFSRAALKNPAIQGQTATATPLLMVFAGHELQELGSDSERWVPAGQAMGEGKIYAIRY